MFDADKRSRFRQLRQRLEGGTVTPEEKGELRKLENQIEGDEATYLTPASERIQSESERLESQNRSLEALVRRREALVERLRVFLAEARSERKAIESELAEVLADGRNGHTEE